MNIDLLSHNTDCLTKNYNIDFKSNYLPLNINIERCLIRDLATSYKSVVNSILISYTDITNIRQILVDVREIMENTFREEVIEEVIKVTKKIIRMCFNENFYITFKATINEYHSKVVNILTKMLIINLINRYQRTKEISVYYILINIFRNKLLQECLTTNFVPFNLSEDVTFNSMAIRQTQNLFPISLSTNLHDTRAYSKIYDTSKTSLDVLCKYNPFFTHLKFKKTNYEYADTDRWGEHPIVKSNVEGEGWLFITVLDLTKVKKSDILNIITGRAAPFIKVYVNKELLKTFRKSCTIDGGKLNAVIEYHKSKYGKKNIILTDSAEIESIINLAFKLPINIPINFGNESFNTPNNLRKNILSYLREKTAIIREVSPENELYLSR